MRIGRWQIRGDPVPNSRVGLMSSSRMSPIGAQRVLFPFTFLIRYLLESQIAFRRNFKYSQDKFFFSVRSNDVPSSRLLIDVSPHGIKLGLTRRNEVPDMALQICQEKMGMSSEVQSILDL